MLNTNICKQDVYIIKIELERRTIKENHLKIYKFIIKYFM